MYLATLRLPGQADPRVIATYLNALALANALWVMDQWAQGLEPPCCVECAGIKWKPDPVSTSPQFPGGPEILRDRVASCGAIAAYEVGCKIAEAVKGGASLDQARAMYRVALVESEPYAVGGRPSTGFGSGPRGRRAYWHAVVQTPNGIEDPTKELQRA